MVERDTIMEEVLESDHHNKKNIIEEEEEEEIMAPGFRFHPTDEELVGFYLQRKVQKKPLPIQLIKQIDIYKYDPWDLPMSSKGEGGMIEEGYFFSMRGRKYRNSIRPNRVTVSGSGFWKATGIDKPIYKDKDNNMSNNIIIGLKKSLVYYLGTAGKGSKTDWMMHEFRLPPSQHNLQESEVWTLCRIFKRMASHKKITPPPSNNATTSKASSLRSSDINGHFTTFKDSLIINVQQQNDDNERKQIMNNNNNNNGDQVEQYERNHLFLGHHHEFLPQAPIPPLVSYPNYTSFWNPNNNDVMMDDQDVFANYGNWDELGPVVHLAMDDHDPLSNLYHNHHCTD